ncbi:hypothetical protein ACFQV8_09050 [Pseudonocardia benzenivorans]
MARLIDTLEVEAPVDTCFARLTAPPARPARSCWGWADSESSTGTRRCGS